MSERVYALLLRLFPARFREIYGEEALQLFRDRSRDESGVFRQLRLWLDLLLDLAVAVPRVQRGARRSMAAAAPPRPAGGPGFAVIEGRRPHPAILLAAAAVSVAVLWVAAVSLRQTPHGWTEGSPSSAQLPLDTPTMKLARGGMQAVTVVETHTPAVRSKTAQDAAGGDTRAGSATLVAAAASAGAPAAMASGATDGPVILDRARRHAVIVGTIARLNEYYLDLPMARQMDDALIAHETHGDDGPMDGWDFAALLTRQLQEVSHDRHLGVGYTPVAMPARPESPTPEDRERFHRDMASMHCLIDSAKMLPHNIGYVKVNGFPDPEVCAGQVAAAMRTVNGASAIIYDLRDNHGGDPHMVAVYLTYLFAHRTHLNDIYSPRTNRTEEFWTMTPAPAGNRLWNKPAYVLTSHRTFSGGEEFCYDLKTRKRATLIGETTGGGAHPASLHWIDDNFNIRVPTARPINPITKKDWEGTGVAPDVPVKADDALTVAERMAVHRVAGR